MGETGMVSSPRVRERAECPGRTGPPCRLPPPPRGGWGPPVCAKLLPENEHHHRPQASESSCARLASADDTDLGHSSRAPGAQSPVVLSPAQVTNEQMSETFEDLPEPRPTGRCWCWRGVGQTPQTAEASVSHRTPALLRHKPRTPRSRHYQPEEPGPCAPQHHSAGPLPPDPRGVLGWC